MLLVNRKFANKNFVMVDLIAKKKHGGVLSREELEFWLTGMLDGIIPDYQTAAMLMAICFSDLNEDETCDLTDIMLNSGEKLDLTALPGIKADKHSTGGVGDKTSLIAMPLAASCGLTVVKMSGRSLGLTGGTADKLESVQGFRLILSDDEVAKQAEKLGLVLITQSGNLTPADKRLYALRDLTATVDSLPLIAASVMSKKLAAGADVIVLDVKYGSGAFMPDAASAVRLAELMVKIGTDAGRKVSAVVSNMEEPLGMAVGNAVEVWESAEVLQGRGAADVRDLSLVLVAEQLYLAGVYTERCAAYAAAAQELASGRGYAKLLAFLQAQGGDTAALESGEFLTAPCRVDVLAEVGGYLAKVCAAEVAEAVQHLGAGRLRLEDNIDHRVGVIFKVKSGEPVQAGDVLAEVLAADEESGARAAAEIRAACSITPDKPQREPLIWGIVTADGVLHGEENACIFGYDGI